MASTKMWWGVCYIALNACLACQPHSSSEYDEKANFSSDSLARQELPSTPVFNPEDEIIGLTEEWKGDLDGMMERRRIRALVPYSQTSYYIDGTERRGIAYEAMLHFEKALNEKPGKDTKVPHVRIIFIPLTRDKLLPALQNGYGDLVVANLTITPQRLQEVDFSIPVLTGAREVVVSGPAAAPLTTFNDLPGKTIHIRASSSFFEHLQGINDSLRRANRPAIHIEQVEEHFEDEEILEMVNAGVVPITIMDEHKARFWSQIFDSIQVRSDIAIYSGGEVAWAMRKNSPQLKSVVDGFIKKNRKGTLLGNIIFNRYLKNADYITHAFTPEDMEGIRTIRDYFIKYAEQYRLDWLLLAAQGYQESRFRQDLVSSAGAVGIMQIKPSTAGDPNIGISDIHRLENNIHAGAKYLRFLIDQYFQDAALDELNASLFAIAAYNAGPRRINDLRRQAAQNGLDPNQWFDHVEIIAAREIGRETVQYVSNIYKYYSSYRSLYRYVQQTGRRPFDDP